MDVTKPFYTFDHLRDLVGDLLHGRKMTWLTDYKNLHHTSTGWEANMEV